MGLYKRGLETGKVPSASPRPVEIVPGLIQDKASVSYKTGIDKFYHLIEASSGISSEKVTEILDVSSSALEEWARILEKQGVIEIVYPATGGTLYQLKATPQAQEELFSQLKKKVFRKEFVLGTFFLLLFVGGGFFLYLSQGSLFSSFSSVWGSLSRVSGDVPAVSYQNRSLEEAFSGKGTYHCELESGALAEEYSLHDMDMRLDVFLDGDYSSSSLIVGNAKYVFSNGVWQATGIGSYDVGPGRYLPTSYDHYYCVVDAFNATLFEVPL